MPYGSIEKVPPLYDYHFRKTLRKGVSAIRNSPPEGTNACLGVATAFGHGSQVMRASLDEIMPFVGVPPCELSEKAEAAIRRQYAPCAEPARLVEALRVYYATLVFEAGRCIAPACDLLSGSGAEPFVQAWPQGHARDALARECGVFGDIARRAAGIDLFHLLYQAVFPAALRHAGGEFYTPAWLADAVLDRAEVAAPGPGRLCDPSCGSGVFLLLAARRLGGTDAVDRIFGFDTNPLAVLTSRVNLLASLGEAAAGRRSPPNVFLHDLVSGDNRWGLFETIVGNPPWVLWDNLSAEYRRQTTGLWKSYGLFSLSAREAQLGGGKKDLAMLVTYAAAANYLADGGRLAFVINQGIFQSGRAGAGFRRFRIGEAGHHLRVLGFDDLTRLSPFDAAARTGVLLLEKGRPTDYPVRYTVWLRDGSRAEMQARPASGDAGAPWEVIDASSPAPAAAPAAYTARTGVYSGGANGVFWVKILDASGGTARIRNIASACKATVPQVTAQVESRLLYPLLRWLDVRRWSAVPRQHVILVQDAASRRPIPEQILRAEFPLAHGYLLRFRDVLEKRQSGIIRRLMGRTAFYAMFGVGHYSLSRWKVVWRRMVREFTAAVAGEADAAGVRRPMLPQETLTFIPCETELEAHYLCAMLNAPQTSARARSLSVAGGKSFGSAGVMKYLQIPRFDPANAIHCELSELSKSAHAACANGREPLHEEMRIEELLAR